MLDRPSRLAVAVLAPLAFAAPTLAFAEPSKPGYFAVGAGDRVEIFWEIGDEEPAAVLTEESGTFYIGKLDSEGRWGYLYFSGWDAGWVDTYELSRWIEPEGLDESRLPLGLSCGGHAPGWSLTLDGAPTLEFFAASMNDPVTLTYQGVTTPTGAGPALPAVVTWLNEDVRLDATIGYALGDGLIGISVLLVAGGNQTVFTGECALYPATVEFLQ